MRFPADPLSRFAHMRADEQAIVRDRNRELYARHANASNTSRDAPKNPHVPPPAGGSASDRPDEQPDDWA
jgi:hypothetical protein